jgi:choline dehydrogenase
LAPDAESIYLLANPVLPHSEGEILPPSADPDVHPTIRMNYCDDPSDMKIMVAVMRRVLDIAEHWPGNIARDNGVKLEEFVGEHSISRH